MINWVLKPLALGQSLHNMGEMEAYLKTECPDIEYTSVRPPQLLNGASSGKSVRTITVFDLISAHFPISAQYDNV